jgi:hypothetical protein
VFDADSRRRLSSMVTFEEARAIVAEQIGLNWTGGTFMVADEGAENTTHWVVTVGAREFLVDHDVAFMLVPGGPVTVDKESGEIGDPPPYLVDSGWYDALTPIDDTPHGPEG